MKHTTCKHCGHALDSFYQESGPYSRDLHGRIVATSRKRYVQCVNSDCPAWMCTASDDSYDDTTGRYVAAKAEASHA